MDIVRITLEKPYYQDPERDLVLRFGTEAGKILLRDGEDPEIQDLRKPTRVTRAEPILYALNFQNADKNGIMVPVEAAKSWFGDWDIPKVSPPGATTDLTFGWEKARVARKWGDYQFAGITNRQVDNTIIGPPNVPHVVIHALDGRGQPRKDFEFRPWAWFEWDKGIEVRPQGLAPQGDADRVTLSRDEYDAFRALLGKTPQKAGAR